MKISLPKKQNLNRSVPSRLLNTIRLKAIYLILQTEIFRNVKARLLDRLNYVSELDDFNKLPDEALNAIKKVTEEI